MGAKVALFPPLSSFYCFSAGARAYREARFGIVQYQGTDGWMAGRLLVVCNLALAIFHALLFNTYCNDVWMCLLACCVQ